MSTMSMYAIFNNILKTKIYLNIIAIGVIVILLHEEVLRDKIWLNTSKFKSIQKKWKNKNAENF